MIWGLKNLYYFVCLLEKYTCEKSLCMKEIQVPECFVNIRRNNLQEIQQKVSFLKSVMLFKTGKCLSCKENRSNLMKLKMLISFEFLPTDLLSLVYFSANNGTISENVPKNYYLLFCKRGNNKNVIFARYL